MEYLFIFNDSPYGSQRAYNGMRLALAVSQKSKTRIFLLGDGVTCAIAGLTPTNADYNLQELLAAIAESKGEIAACRTCLDARGFAPEALIAPVQRGSLDQLVQWTEEADKIISF